MTAYKITNITENFGKRDRNFNKTVSISYVDQMERKTIALRPKETVFLTVPSLPIDIHSLRIKGLVSVSEISLKELKNIQKSQNKTTKKPVSKTEKKPVVTKPKAKKKSDSKKEDK